MATTKNTYTGNNSTTNYAFTFPYIKQADVKVSLDDVVKSLTSDYTFADATTISFNSAPGTGVAIAIYRSTDDSNLVATFYPGSAIRSTDLNDNYTQNLYVTQESSNLVTDANTTAGTAVTTANTAKATADDAADDVKRWIKDGDGTDTAGDEDDADFSARPLKPQGVPYAVAQAASAVSTANTASTNATNAVNTANTASTNATAALNNSRESDGSGGYNSAISIANTASTNATNAVNTANTASTNASNAVSTANAADTIADNAKLATDRLVATTSNGGATWTLTGNNTNASTDPKGVGYAVTQAEAAVTTANAAAADVAAAVLYTSVANKTALEALTPSEDGYYEVKDSTGLANATWGTPTYTLSGIPGTYPSSALDGITTRLNFTLSSKTFAYTSYTVNDADARYINIDNTTALIPTGTTAQRPGSASSGMFRFNTTDSKFEGYDGSAWDEIGAAIAILDGGNFDTGGSLVSTSTTYDGGTFT